MCFCRLIAHHSCRPPPAFCSELIIQPAPYRIAIDERRVALERLFTSVTVAGERRVHSDTASPPRSCRTRRRVQTPRRLGQVHVDHMPSSPWAYRDAHLHDSGIARSLTYSWSLVCEIGRNVAMQGARSWARKGRGEVTRSPEPLSRQRCRCKQSRGARPAPRLDQSPVPAPRVGDEPHRTGSGVGQRDEHARTTSGTHLAQPPGRHRVATMAVRRSPRPPSAFSSAAAFPRADGSTAPASASGPRWGRAHSWSGASAAASSSERAGRPRVATRAR